jgi:hypothetical protein
MDFDYHVARRMELSALADEIENSDRPSRVKVIRMKHIRDELSKLLVETEARIVEEVEKIKNGSGSL